MNSINWVQLICGLIGGLGLFLYGMKLMSDGLQKSAGNSLRRILEKLTSNRIIGTFVGLVVTSIIQSSSATTVMVVGFVNAGLMNLTQALSVVLGANIGTTVTAQLIAFNISALALPAIGCGVFIRMFAKDNKLKSYGEVLIGFGLLFLGLETMKHSFVPLRHSDMFKNAFIFFSKNHVMAVLAGALLTIIVQSSSATIGITIALATTGLIDIYASAALILGENIGTTITANLAAIGTNKSAKRAAFGHFLFNVIGVIYMLIFLKFFIAFIASITPGDPNFINAQGINPHIARHIANIHTMFNVVNTLIFLPILHYLVQVCNYIIKGEDVQECKLLYIDDRLIETPSLAVTQAKKELRRMSNVAYGMLDLSKQAFFNYDLKIITKIYQMEDMVDLLEKNIFNYLVKLIQHPSNNENTINDINSMLYVLHDIEKVGDYSEDIAQLTEKLILSKIYFSEPAIAEMSEIYDVVLRFSDNVLKSYHEGNFPKSIDTKDEYLIDQLRLKFRNNHMDRLQDKICTMDNGIIYMDILNNLEKAGDHIFNIARVISGESKLTK